MYELGLMREAVDDLAELDPPVAQRILNKLRRMADNFEALTPQPLGYEWQGAFKLRIGDYRAVYTINHSARRITVHLVGHRREVYKKR